MSQELEKTLNKMDKEVVYMQQPGFVWSTRNIKYSDYRFRSNASSGYFLSVLLPLTMLSNFMQTHTTNIPQHYMILTIFAISMCIESLIFYVQLVNTNTYKNWTIFNIMPTILIAVLLKMIVNVSWLELIVMVKVITWLYKMTCANVMAVLPNTFTYGEASMLIQGLLLFVLNSIICFYNKFWENISLTYQKDQEEVKIANFDQINFIMMMALLWLFIMCLLLSLFKCLRRTLPFYILLSMYVVCATCLPLTQPLPIIIVGTCIFEDNLRPFIVLFYVILTSFTIYAIRWHLSRNKQATTAIRKIFHIILVLIYMPSVLYDCVFIYLASGIAFAIMTIMELLRVYHISPFNNMLESIFHSFVDKKDSGLLAVTPFTLLIGFSMPLWLQVQPCSNMKSLALLAGVLTVGFGDTAASIIGSKVGQIKWQNSSRTVEGSIAFCLACYMPINLMMHFGYLPEYNLLERLWIFLGIICSALLEAYTDQIDNLVVPIPFYVFIHCLT